MFATTKALAFQRSAELARLRRRGSFFVVVLLPSVRFGTPSEIFSYWKNSLVPLQEGQLFQFVLQNFL